MTDYLLLAARALTATVFALAFVGKARGAERFGGFVTSIHQLALIPRRAATPVALAIVIGEGAAVLLLILPFAPRLGSALAVALLAVFIAAVVRSVRGGVFAECRCFGSRGAVMSHAMIVRNLLLMAIAVPGVAAAPVPTGRPVAAVAAVLAGVLAAALFTRYYDRGVAALMRRLVAAERAEAPR
ncbi:MauE/DoxX family redox-associated membrane protein [Actinomadura sp. NPDC047616]|uniref:MauE/DoxX family redox-associated membrane protein n=1 Tax=Actinomadura sp. NPDC047616 TaxID=3155914 RepID=UPI0033C7945B